ncbi:unnamed protein product [Periconia digitata]|uniref:Uncharacterized protein n=1 Tax=Periconia digitata TaxID=1303443 RepID=A0A9W4U7H6_9PLEO|nr:unnamed protein product [Periconia digitata]
MYVAAHSLRVTNMTSSRLWPPHDKNPTVKLYAFKQSTHEVPHTFPVRLLPGTKILAVGHIQVRVPGLGWRMLEEWLIDWAMAEYERGTCDMTYDERRAFYKHPVAGLKAQGKWWAKNRKHFPVMTLPAEIRSIVWRHALGSNISPFKTSDRHGNSQLSIMDTWKDDIESFDDFQRKLARGSINHNLLLVSKAVNKEAFLAARMATKHFTDCHVLGDLIRNLAPQQMNWLGKIHLDMDLTVFFDFFGVTVEPFLQFTTVHDGISGSAVLKRLPALRVLELNVQSPWVVFSRDRRREPSRFAERNPWRKFRSESGMTYDEVDVEPCFKVVVDWMLLAAFPFIQQIPKIVLLGAVKTCLREKWRAILAQAKREKHLDEADRSFSYEMEVQRLMLNPPSILNVPECHCPASCKDSLRPRDLLEFDSDDAYVKDEVH